MTRTQANDRNSVVLNDGQSFNAESGARVANYSFRRRFGHTSGVQGIVRLMASAATWVALSTYGQVAALDWQSAVERATRGAPEAQHRRARHRQWTLAGSAPTKRCGTHAGCAWIDAEAPGSVWACERWPVEPGEPRRLRSATCSWRPSARVHASARRLHSMRARRSHGRATPTLPRWRARCAGRVGAAASAHRLARNNRPGAPMKQSAEFREPDSMMRSSWLCWESRACA